MPTAPTGRPDRSGSDPLKKGDARLSEEDEARLEQGSPADPDLADDDLVDEDATDLAADEDDLDADDDDEDDDAASTGTTLTKKRARTAAGTSTATRSAVKSKPERRRGERSGNPFVRMVRFIREVVGEMRKVLWPTRRELGVYTVAVIIFVTVMIAIVGGLDFGFARLVLLVFG